VGDGGGGTKLYPTLGRVVGRARWEWEEEKRRGLKASVEDKRRESSSRQKVQLLLN